MTASNYLRQYTSYKVAVAINCEKLAELQKMKVMIQNGQNDNVHLLPSIENMIYECCEDISDDLDVMCSVTKTIHSIPYRDETYLLLVLYYINGLTVNEVCNRLKISPRKFYRLKENGFEIVQAILDAT